jgi:small subunit ribosomal protein S12
MFLFFLLLKKSKMPTLTQLAIKHKGRLRKIKKCRTKALKGAPHRFGVAIKVYTTSPKKPNSAVRKVVKVKLSTGRKLLLPFLDKVIILKLILQ